MLRNVLKFRNENNNKNMNERTNQRIKDCKQNENCQNDRKMHMFIFASIISWQNNKFQSKCDVMIVK